MRFVLLLTHLLLACGDDDAAPCDEPGASGACECTGEVTGYRVCLEDGSFSQCVCQADRTVPCSAPGNAFACRCADGMLGVEYCLQAGAYSACDCTAPQTGRGDGGITTDVPPPAMGCPAPYACTEQMGVTLCTDGAGVPPLCEDDSDCVAAGIPDAPCVDPAGLGVTLCFKICQP